MDIKTIYQISFHAWDKKIKNGKKAGNWKCLRCGKRRRMKRNWNK